MSSDYEEDVDDDLPSISLSQSTGEKSETEMPPAAEVAWERAREAAAERALQALRAPAPGAAPGPAPPDHGEAELVERWSELRVSTGDAREGELRSEREGEDTRTELLRALRDAMPDATLLHAYSAAVARHPHAEPAIAARVLAGIVRSLSRGHSVGPGAAAWLLAAAAADSRARRALHAVLDREDAPEVWPLCFVCRSLRARAPALLTEALRQLPPATQETMQTDADPTDPTALLSAAASLAAAAWPILNDARRRLLLRGAARALASPLPAGEARALLLALQRPLPRSAALHTRQQVLSGVAKLQLLFGEPRLSNDDDAERDTKPASNPQSDTGLASNSQPDTGFASDPQPDIGPVSTPQPDIGSTSNPQPNTGPVSNSQPDIGPVSNSQPSSPSPERKRLCQEPRDFLPAMVP